MKSNKPVFLALAAVLVAGCASLLTINSGFGRISNTNTAEKQAKPAKMPKISGNGTSRSRSTPNPQSAKPPQLMLTMFMTP